MPSPNKEETKLEPRTTHVPKSWTRKKIQRDTKYLIRHGTNQPNRENTKDQNSMARKGRGTIWIGRLDQFESRNSNMWK